MLGQLLLPGKFEVSCESDHPADCVTAGRDLWLIHQRLDGSTLGSRRVCLRPRCARLYHERLLRMASAGEVHRSFRGRVWRLPHAWVGDATEVCATVVLIVYSEMGPGDNIGLVASKTCATGIRGQYYAIAAATGKPDITALPRSGMLTRCP